jgi:hypothetical protein
MKTMKGIMLTGGLAGVLVVLSAFTRCRDEQHVTHESTPRNGKGFAVVELFTSEGCSSCPPADELIKRIQADNKNKQVYILAYHVDYWDHQGWKDRFSDPAYSKRQRRYAGWLNLQTVYTPQMVVNGTSEYVGSDQRSVLQAISAGLTGEPTNTLTLTGKIAGDQLQVEYQEAGHEKRSELVLALVQQSAQSAVKAGENEGRNLSHVQIVRRMLHVPLDMNSKKEITMKLPDDFNKQGWELIGFVQHTKDGSITAAARFNFQG